MKLKWMTLWFAMACVVAGCGGHVERTEEHPSPDGKYVATFLLLNAGATVSYMPEVSLHDAGTSVGSRGNVFRGYRTDRLKIEWTSNTNLIIRHSPDCQVDRHTTHWRDVQIDVIQDGSWM